MGHSKSKSRRRESSHFTNQRLPTRVNDPFARVSRNYQRQFDDWDVPEERYVTRQTELVSPRRSRANLRLVEDRRRYHPDGARRPAIGFNKWAPRVIVPKWAALGGAAVTAKLAFSSPDQVALCVRRKIRREVMFAKGKGGRRGQRRPRRSWYSRISCRR